MKELIEDLFSCHGRHDCLKKWVDCPFPEPFIGNLRARFAIIGANPGRRTGLSFRNVREYASFYERDASDLLGLKEKQNGYLEAYRMLVNPKARTAEFNGDAIVLNFHKVLNRKIPVRHQT